MKTKIQKSIDRIRYYADSAQHTSMWPRIAVAYSGGKDSDVVLELAKRSEVDFKAVMNLTSVDMPPVVQYVRKFHPEVEIRAPAITMWELIPKHASMPLRNARFCCKYLKERMIKCELLIDGVRWQESGARSKRNMFEAARNESGRMFFLHPIIDWTEKEVWQFIEENNLPHCPLYHEGFTRNNCTFVFKRIGCVGCPYCNDDRLIHFILWPEYKRGYINAAQEMINRRNERIKMGLTKAPPFSPWKTGNDVVDWWLKNETHNSPTKCDGGVSMFIGEEK